MLDAQSDFTPFMRAGVPPALRNQALRLLWRLDPALANLDGLNDYDEDFTAPRRGLAIARAACRAVGTTLDDAETAPPNPPAEAERT
jgi:hypothetical protein